MIRRQDELRIALIGCGGIAETYSGVYCADPRVSVVAVCDVQLETAEALRNQHHLPPIATANVAEALAYAPDLAVISTPNEFHLDHAVAALRAGAHIFVQKPLARNSTEAREILAEAERVGRRVGVYMNSLDDPLFYDIRDAIDEGWFGTIVKLRLSLAHLGGLMWDASSWRASKERSGGGSFILLAPHLIHLAQWLTGTRIERLIGIQRRVALPQIEGDDVTVAVAEFADGVVGEFCTGWSFDDLDISVFGTNGRIRVEDRRVRIEGGTHPIVKRVIAYEPPGPHWVEVKRVAMGELDNPLEQHRAAIDALVSGQPFVVTGESALADLVVIEQMGSAQP